ncbi:MAG: glycoside hydrolase family 4, partial [Armatimonadia bacterium]
AAYQAGCLPLSLPPVPVGVAAWVTEALYGVELTVEAALQGSHELLVQALLYDRCVTDLRAATRLADDLLAAHKAHLPQFS